MRGMKGAKWPIVLNRRGPGEVARAVAGCTQSGARVAVPLQEDTSCLLADPVCIGVSWCVVLAWNICLVAGWQMIGARGLRGSRAQLAGGVCSYVDCCTR